MQDLRTHLKTLRCCIPSIKALFCLTGTEKMSFRYFIT